jgi:hypothetical protein
MIPQTVSFPKGTTLARAISNKRREKLSLLIRRRSGTCFTRNSDSCSSSGTWPECESSWRLPISPRVRLLTTRPNFRGQPLYLLLPDLVHGSKRSLGVSIPYARLPRLVHHLVMRVLRVSLVGVRMSVGVSPDGVVDSFIGLTPRWPRSLRERQLGRL